MKHLSLLLTILTVNIINSQCYEHIKKLDTIYIPFREGKYEIKFDYPVEKDGFKNRSYLFNYKKKDNHGFDFEIYKNKTSENKSVNKCFLKKNKAKIVEIDSLRKFDYQDIQCELFSRLKIFYIVDFSEKKGKQIKLYRVMFMRHCYSIE
jgi:hypothetical protein